MGSIPVTFMELTAPPAAEPLVPRDSSISAASERLGAEPYMAHWERVGAPLGWDGRRLLTRDAVAKILASEKTDIHVLRVNDEPVGLCEFNRPDPPDSEIKYFGLVPAAQGRGFGPYLLDAALRCHWREFRPNRIWLHTDSADHPKAIATYMRAGFSTFAEHLLSDNAVEADYRAAIGLPTKD